MPKKEIEFPNAVSVNLSDEMCNRLKEMAEEEGRTVSQQVRWLVAKIFRIMDSKKGGSIDGE